MKKKLVAIIMVILAIATFAGCGESEPQVVYVEVPSTPSPTEVPMDNEPSLTELYSSARPGNIITFGTYEQDNNLTNGKEPIEWIVLSNKNGKLFLVSRYVLDYDKWGTVTVNIVWPESNKLRSWMNETFYQDAFSEEEKDYILKTELEVYELEWNANLRDYYEKSEKPRKTEDYIFPLSLTEIHTYLENPSADPTDYALAMQEAAGFTPRENGMGWITRSFYDGEKSYVYDSWDSEWHAGWNTGAGIRPAMYIRLK